MSTSRWFASTVACMGQLAPGHVERPVIDSAGDAQDIHPAKRRRTATLSEEGGPVREPPSEAMTNNGAGVMS